MGSGQSAPLSFRRTNPITVVFRLNFSGDIYVFELCSPIFGIYIYIGLETGVRCELQQQTDSKQTQFHCTSVTFLLFFTPMLFLVMDSLSFGKGIVLFFVSKPEDSHWAPRPFLWVSGRWTSHVASRNRAKQMTQFSNHRTEIGKTSGGGKSTQT